MDDLRLCALKITTLPSNVMNDMASIRSRLLVSGHLRRDDTHEFLRDAKALAESLMIEARNEKTKRRLESGARNTRRKISAADAFDMMAQACLGEPQSQ